VVKLRSLGSWARLPERTTGRRASYAQRVRVTYDPEVDAAYIRLTDQSLEPGRQSIPCNPPEGIKAWVVMDWKDGKIVGLEVLDAAALLPADLLASARRPGRSQTD
jgi:uncharacterized protein YuzE